MENEIMNVAEEVMENNEDIMTDVCTNGGLGRGVVIGAGLTAIGYGLYKLGRMAWTKFKNKKDHGTVNIPEDITDDDLDEIPE